MHGNRPLPMLIDAHTHLDLVAERGIPVPDALRHAREGGVTHIITASNNPADAAWAVEAAGKWRGVSATVGWHPMEDHVPDSEELEALRKLAAQEHAVAIGEVGLDYYFRPGYHETPKDVQQASLEIMLALAHELDLPVVIHARDAQQDILAMLRNSGTKRVLFHCFQGDVAHARACLEEGYLISFSGIVTFRTAAELQEVAKFVPGGTFTIETDAPFLTPVPYRGSTNEPVHVRETAAFLAACRNTTPEAIALDATATAAQFFQLPPSDAIGEDGHLERSHHD